MGPGFLARLLSIASVICVAAASSSDQQMLFGDFHRWSWTSPETITFFVLGITFGIFAAAAARAHRDRTQIRRDRQASEILESLEDSKRDE